MDEIAQAIKHKDIDKLKCLLEQPLFSFGENKELLGLLFPKEPHSYNKEFSQTALLLLLERGWLIGEDEHFTGTFFTKCNRQCFKDFCGAVKNNPLYGPQIFAQFLEHNYPWYEEHFEYLMSPCVAQGNYKNTSSLEQLWHNFWFDGDYCLQAEEVAEAYLQTSQGLLEYMSNTTMKECIPKAWGYMEKLKSFAETPGYFNPLVVSHVDAVQAKMLKVDIVEELGEREGKIMASKKM